MRIFIVALCLLTVTWCPLFADRYGADVAADISVEAEQGFATDKVNTGAVSLEYGADVTNQYIFRGLFQDNEGLILQPYVTINVALFDIDNVGTVSALVGTWQSLHTSDDTGTGSDVTNDPQFWFESDFYAGLTLDMGCVNFSAVYQIYVSPNDSFDSIEEWQFSLSFDDSEILPIALNPSAFLGIETNIHDGGVNDEGIYLGISIEPSFDLQVLQISFPATVGFSLHDYYQDVDNDDDDDFFGYVQFGIATTVPLTFVPSIYGEWQLVGKVEAVVLGDNTSELNQAANQDFEVITTVGIHSTY